jgi:hypothetical protein
LTLLQHGGIYRGYAERYKSFRLWPKGTRSLVRRVKSENRVRRAMITRPESQETEPRP